MKNIFFKLKLNQFFGFMIFVFSIWYGLSDYENILALITSVDGIHLILGFLFGIGIVYLLSKWGK
ncbi:hypothetical protein Runsl_4394 [Runella slithyformis DSM 19594]|uniref:Uncharacterized protein n=1 Tax=Runella slithyformis (strain ATCC 29530 / DSM 19594 / LMG 11500 / NCIMB 11436 / LSU 4) TaxID=761193 RepID=A0A7U3ZP51_RUNSL|nr:hypothetical protein Runsl_4394 [Runella slithyformis DSM 19594]